MKIIRFAIAAAALCLTAMLSAAALGVDEDEIRVTGDVGAIQFENYTGPHTVIETADAITEIGRGLGRQVSRSVSKAGSFNPNGKYSIIHAIDENEQGKFDADILILGPNASVDHIKNLRRIIAGYLTAAYGYSSSDATTIATFVTVYNAVYRQKLDVFQDRYKTVVTKNLTKEKCGLSTKWSDWPGNTQIVIPLRDLNGGLSTVDTSVISDRNVVDNMREENDRGIDARQDMVDIKEREAEQAAEKAEQAAEKADQEKQKLAEQEKARREAEQAADKASKDAGTADKTAQNAQKKADDAKKKADEAAKKAEEAKKSAGENPDDAAAQAAAKKAEEDAKKAEQARKKAEEDAKKAEQDALAAQEKADEAARKAQEEAEAAAAQKEKAEAAQAEVDEHQSFADKKEAEAQAERTEIAKDKQALLEEALALDEGNAIIGLKVVNETKDLSQMVKVSMADGSTLKLSPVNVVHERTIFPVANPVIEDAKESSVQTASIYYIAICGDGSASSNNAVKLCLLDSMNMEIQKESNEMVANDSVLVTDGNGGYYCVIKDDSNYVVAKYNKSLQLQVKSPVAVESNTPIVISDRGVVVVAASGSIVLLDGRNLDSSF
ncbi:MAG: hypothetical protein K6G18_06665 [Treponema sp.]|nr:hypothetical protein [Treponema sp.]